MISVTRVKSMILFFLICDVINFNFAWKGIKYYLQKLTIPLLTKKIVILKLLKTTLKLLGTVISRVTVTQILCEYIQDSLLQCLVLYILFLLCFEKCPLLKFCVWNS